MKSILFIFGGFWLMAVSMAPLYLWYRYNLQHLGLFGFFFIPGLLLFLYGVMNVFR